ncbi:MAG: Bug family tripartite tricarboxylate transporter substrate binding protein [Burkholderiaceae bacterium]
MDLSSRSLLSLIAGACLVAASAPVAAQTAPYPTAKPIQLIVPFPPGGVTDAAARLLAQEMETTLKQRIVVSNKAGAGGMIGGTSVVNSPADGYTVCFCTVNPAMLATVVDPNPPYQPLRDLAPVGQVSKVENSIIARTGLAADSLPALIELARKNPGKITYATTGVGSFHHFIGEYLMHTSGVRLVHVPYKGEAPALQAVMAGEVDLAIISLYSGDSVVQQKRAKPIAVAQSTRSARWPDVPTMEESGFPGLVAEAFAGLSVPAGTPPEVINTLHSAMAQALKNPTLRKRFETDGNPPVGSTPAEYGAFLAREVKRWSELSRAANLKLDRN